MKINQEVIPVKKIMKSPILAIDKEKHIMEVGQMMRDKGVRHLAVIDDGQIVGMLCIADILSHQLNMINGDRPSGPFQAHPSFPSGRWAFLVLIDNTDTLK